jgi:hypothetical protein
MGDTLWRLGVTEVMAWAWAFVRWQHRGAFCFFLLSVEMAADTESFFCIVDGGV